MAEDRRAVDSWGRLAIDVALTPAFVDTDPAHRGQVSYIVVDVIRATTTLAVMFAGGCRRALVAPGIAAARAVAEGAPGRYLLGGEVGGLAPPGFDFGNSPREYAAADLRERDVLFATTNGTRALRACAGGRAIFAGAFRNAGAVARAAVDAASSAPAGGDRPPPGATSASTSANSDGGASEAAIPSAERASGIVVVCSGRRDRPAHDDTLCAGYLVEELMGEAYNRGIHTTLGEQARIARDVAWDAKCEPERIRDILARSDAGRAITAAGLAGDLDWCAAIDATDAVPSIAGFDDARDLLELRPYPFAASPEGQ